LVQAKRWIRNISLRSSCELIRTKRDTKNDKFENFRKTFRSLDRPFFTALASCCHYFCGNVRDMIAVKEKTKRFQLLG